MKVERFESPATNETKITATMDSLYLEVVGRMIQDETIRLVADELSKKFLQEKGAEILASIPLQAVVNRAIADAVRRIGNASETVEPSR